MFKFIALAILVALSGADAFWRCCANQPQAFCPTRIVSPYCDATRCVVTRGDWLTAEADFVPLRAHQRLDVEITATALGITVPIPVFPPGDNACNSLFRNGVSVGCPTVPNVSHTWIIEDEIPTVIPAFNSAVVRYMLRENGVIEGCVDIDAQIN